MEASECVRECVRPAKHYNEFKRMNLLRVSGIKIWMAFLVQSITLCSESVSKPWVHLILLEAPSHWLIFICKHFLALYIKWPNNSGQLKQSEGENIIWKKSLLSFDQSVSYLGKTRANNFAKKNIIFHVLFLVCHFIRKNTGNASSNSIFASWKELSLFFSLS